MYERAISFALYFSGRLGELIIQQPMGDEGQLIGRDQ